MIYTLNKDGLIAELDALGLDNRRTADDLRHCLSQYVSEHPEMFPNVRNAEPGPSADARKPATMVSEPSTALLAEPTPLPAREKIAPPHIREPSPENIGKIMNQIRK